MRYVIAPIYDIQLFLFSWVLGGEEKGRHIQAFLQYSNPK